MMHKMINFLLLISVVLIGCSQYIQEFVSETDPVVQDAEPYISKIVFEDSYLRKLATWIVSKCPYGDKECQINEIYRYIVENYNYYSDPRQTEYIQSPLETINYKGGDCEDLSILLNSLLENIGIKTYLVLTEDHAYSLACGINTEELQEYVEEDIITQFSENFGRIGDCEVVVKNRELFMVCEEKGVYTLDAGYIIYHGGDGSDLSTY